MHTPTCPNPLQLAAAQLFEMSAGSRLTQPIPPAPSSVKRKGRARPSRFQDGSGQTGRTGRVTLRIEEGCNRQNGR
jgi:hypothetical protein